jgi:O-antigen/teichoic acid export membrane protein
LRESDKQLGRGTVYIYIESVIAMIFGYIFWIILSRIGTIEIIGTFSTVVSLANILAVIASFGVPEGVQRFLGKFFYKRQLNDAKVFVKSSFILVSGGIIVCSLFILALRDWIYVTFAFDLNLIIALIMLTASSTVYLLVHSVTISSLNTKILPTTMISSWVVRIGLGTVVILAGVGAFGMVLAYTVGYIVSSVLLSTTLLLIFKNTVKNKGPEVSFTNASKDVSVSSVASWIPDLIMIIGIQLGTVVVFGTHGSNAAALYFISLTIVSGITVVVYSIFTIALPALSSMIDGRKRFAWHTIRLSLIISLPLTSSLIFYSKDIMQLIGQDYSEGSLSLQILLLSMLPTAVQAGIGSLVYSYGHYRNFLIIGLASSIPRTILYFMLVPMYGSVGASLAYTIGSLIGFAVSTGTAKRIGMLIFWKDLALIFFIPLALAFVLEYLHVNYVIAILATVMSSYAIFMKLQILTRSDLEYCLKILPEYISNPILTLLARHSRK